MSGAGAGGGGQGCLRVRFVGGGGRGCAHGQWRGEAGGIEQLEGAALEQAGQLVEVAYERSEIAYIDGTFID